MKNIFNKTLSVALPLALLLSCFSASAQVTLTVDENIKVTAINGQAMNTSMFMNPKMEYVLTAGKNVITAKYDRFYKLQGDNHDYLRSNNLTVIADLVDNKAYQLVMPNQPEKYQEAKVYVEQPKLAIQLNGEAVATAIPTNTDESNMSLSNLGSRLFGGEDSAVLINNQAIVGLNNANSFSSQSTLATFKQLWQQATPKERMEINSFLLSK